MAWSSRPSDPSNGRERDDKYFPEDSRCLDFYYEIMVASALSDFTEMVGMGVHLEEAVREGRLTSNENSGSTKKPSYGFVKNKEGDENVVIQ